MGKELSLERGRILAEVLRKGKGRDNVPLTFYSRFTDVLDAYVEATNWGPAGKSHGPTCRKKLKG